MWNPDRDKQSFPLKGEQIYQADSRRDCDSVIKTRNRFIKLDLQIFTAGVSSSVLE